MTPTPLPLDIPISELAALVDGSPIDPAGEFSSLRISGFASLLDARPGDLAFFNNDRYLEELTSTGASAVLVRPGFTHQIPGLLPIEVASPSASFAKVVEKYAPRPRPFRPGVHRSAVIEDGVQLDPEKVCVGPNVTIESGTTVGDGTEIRAGVFIGENSTIGRDCLLFPNVTIYHGCVLGDRVSVHANTAIGSDGFGYETAAGSHSKIEQMGIVQIDDDCEIGAAVTIDRARFGRTWIGAGTKIDNNCQIGHNVVMGKDCIVVAAAAIAGSVRIGDRVTMAAQIGIAGHLTIGDDVVLAARSGVTKSLPGKAIYMGFPAEPVKDAKRNLIYPRRIPEILKRLKALEKDSSS